ncbi:MAG TPA: sensor domain-containing diguanylate cyclase [Acidimicrobiia bacterium]|nr:sensor domain-containing diguanylate cyclase [Acidimicrobiia bacterium]
MTDVDRADPAVLETGYRALLQANDRARITAINSHGLFVAVPSSLDDTDHERLGGRSALDLVPVDQRSAVIDAWDRVRSAGAAHARVRLTRGGDAAMYFFDLREIHDVLVCVLVADGDSDIGHVRDLDEVAPRVCVQRKNESAIFVDVDEATSKMLGWSADEFLGHGSLEFVHPDDHDRAIESWMDMLSAPGAQRRTRLRYRHIDGSWLWLELTNHNLLHDEDHHCVVTEMLDVSDEMAAHEAVRFREQLLRRVAETVPLGLLHIDRTGEIRYANERLYELLAMSKSDMGVTPFVQVLPDDRTELALALDGLMIDGIDRDLEVAVRTTRHDDRRLCLLRLRALTDLDGEVGGAIVCVEDVTERANARTELERRATYDPLTGCLNRASVLQRLTAQLGSAQPVGVIFIDLDGFKAVNDERGHSAGDDVLVEVARRTKDNIRASDTLGRLGGDEFLVVCPDGDLDALAAIAARITNSLTTPLVVSHGPIAVRASIGTASADGRSATIESLIAAADTAMYVSKRNGDGRPVAYDPSAHAL